MFLSSKVLKRACCLMLALFLMSACSFAETTVTIDNLCYGQTIDRMFVDEIPYTVSFMGHDWSFDEIFAYEDENHFGGVVARGLGERNSKVKHLPRMMGGKTLSVYEFTVYKDDFSAAPGDEELHLVTVEFDIPYETTIYAGVGNRKTGVYTFEEPIVVNGYYSEDIYMPRSETKLPAVVDRLYLYSYNTPSGPHYMALSLFINYDNLAEFYPAAETVSVPSETIVPSVTPVPSVIPDKKPLSPDYNVLFLYLQNSLPISREMILRVVEAGDESFDGLRLILADHGVEFPFSDMEIIKYSLDLGISVSEETIRRAVDSNEATMDELRDLFASRNAEFPIQEEISYTISYQAMELYLGAGVTPPADIVKQAKEENNLSDEYLSVLFAAYGFEYKAAEPENTPAPKPTPNFWENLENEINSSWGQTLATPTPTPASVRKVINAKSDPEDIKALQWQLIELGWLNAETPSGKYDSETSSAVKSFQHSMNVRFGANLKEDGICGPATFEYLDNYAISTNPSPIVTAAPDTGDITSASSPLRIRELQNKLIILGWFEGNSTGIYDTATTSAVMAFQNYVNAVSGTQILPVNGIADTFTQSMMNSPLYAKPQPTPTLPPAATPTPTPTADPYDQTDLLTLLASPVTVEVNVDQAYVYERASQNAKVLGSISRGNTYLKVAENETWVMIIGENGAAAYTYGAIMAEVTENDPVEDPGSITPDSSKESIRQLQKQLADLGWIAEDEVDGIYGNITKNAVRNFQTYVNKVEGREVVQVTGIADPNTLDLLLEEELYANPDVKPAPTDAPFASYDKPIDVTVSVDTLSVYEQPDHASKILGTMRYGSAMKLLADNGVWGKVQNTAGATGYALISGFTAKLPENTPAPTPSPAPAVTPSPAPSVTFTDAPAGMQVTVIKNSAVVYSEPSLSASPLGNVGAGQNFILLAISDEWLMVSNGSAVGYMLVSDAEIYTEPEVTPAPSPVPTETAKPTVAPFESAWADAMVVITAGSGRVYENPSESSNLLGIMNTGSKLNLLGYNSDWFMVSNGSATGYIRTDSAEFYTAPAETPTPTPVPPAETLYTDAEYDYAYLMATVLFGEPVSPELVMKVIESGAISEAEARLILEEYGYDLNAIFGDTDQEIPETVSTVRAKLETLEGFEYDAGAGIWTYGIPYTKDYSNGKMQIALLAPGRGNNIDAALAFTVTFTDHASGSSPLDVQSIDVLAGDTVYSFPAVFSDEQLSAGTALYGENGKLFTEALAAADAIDVRLNTENGTFTESIPAELYADTLKQTAAQLISLDVFSSWIIDSEIADRYPDDSITLREAPAKTVSSDFVSVSSFDGTWTLGVPYRSFYSNGTLRAALTLHGEGKTIHGVPVFTAGFVNAEENELLLDVSSILVIADGKEFFFDAPEAAVNGYSNLLIGENGRAFVEALCNANEVILHLNTEGGSATVTISGDGLEETLKASAQAIMEVFYSK